MINKTQIPNLNGVRAIAALSVVFGHIEQVKGVKGISFYQSGFIANEGSFNGVLLFFVLSGFLITHVLIQEYQAYGIINVKNFFIRRSLRIWPLYFLILFISVFIGNSDLLYTELAFGILLCPNLFHAFYRGYPLSPQIWSIGVEEQFYLLWPFLFVYLNRFRILRLLFFLSLFIVLFTFIPHILGFINNNYANIPYFKEIDRLLYGAKFNVIGIGCLIGYLYNYKNNLVVKLFYNRISEIMIVSLTVVVWFFGYQISSFNSEMYTCLFALMILCLSNKNSFFSAIFNHKWMNFLGTISYGIYMFHFMLIFLLIEYFLPFYKVNYLLSDIFMYMTVFATTILLSFVSYKYYESFFLRLKSKF